MPSGQWEKHGESSILAVQAALLPSGKVLAFGGSQHYQKPRLRPGLLASDGPALNTTRVTR
jgi:hypothetical protein